MHLMKTTDTTVLFKVTNGSESRCDSTVAFTEIQQTVLGEPDAHWVPSLKWSPPSSRGSYASDSSMDDASTAPNSPVSEDMTDSIEWDNHNLMYLLSILKPDEVAADDLTFNPPLEVLEDLTYPFHLQIHKKGISIPRGFAAYTYSKDAPIGTGRPQPRILIAESTRGCLSPELARRSLAHDMMSDHQAIDAAIGRFNALWAIHSSEVPTLESMLRAMEEMIIITDDEWKQRLNQLCGMAGDVYVGECVDGECSIETRLEYYLLLAGRDTLEDWIRCVGQCLGMESDEERAEHAETYGQAGSFLGQAFEEMLDEA
jgi:hypothetical protein